MMSSSNPVNPGQPLQATINKYTGGNDFQQKHVKDLHGICSPQTAVVTGGTAGIGYEVAKSLVLAGARVVALSRKPEHGDDALNSIKEAAAQIHGHSGRVDFHFVKCDFGSLKEVRAVADRVAREEERIDILINDAGIGVSNYALDADGIERIFGVNVVGHFLFINRLLPTIRKTARAHSVVPRIVNLTSNMHKLAPGTCKFASLAEINDDSLRPDAYYERSKLAIILYTRALATRVLAPSTSDEKILTCSVHPGAVATEIQEQFKQAFGVAAGALVKALQVSLMRSPAEGSLGTLWAAVAPEVEGRFGEVHGAYIPDPGKIGGETKQAQDATLEENVWRLCESLIKEKAGADALYPWDEGSQKA
ncbi:NAD(P)-binding protein [Auricularia subglabra TFB-10046 SS5]|nr:NAD(P)-binding protein [Auricularia subglabra TFB-10046 SS5]